MEKGHGARLFQHESEKGQIARIFPTHLARVFPLLFSLLILPSRRGSAPWPFLQISQFFLLHGSSFHIGHQQHARLPFLFTFRPKGRGAATRRVSPGFLQCVDSNPLKCEVPATPFLTNERKPLWFLPILPRNFRPNLLCFTVSFQGSSPSSRELDMILGSYPANPAVFLPCHVKGI
jgi:hypothetical protein